MPTISFSGLASGIDSDALIKATTDAARSVKVTPLKTKISNLEDTNTALGELKTKLTDLQSMLRNFSSLNGGGLLKVAKSSDETIVTASASSSANNGTYSLSVSAVAQNATHSFKNASAAYSTSSSVINSGINNGAAAANRTVTVTVGVSGSDLETVAVVLTNTTTLDGYVASYNASATKSIASVVNVGSTSSPDYRVVITTNNPGLQKGQIAVSQGSEVDTGTGGWDSNTTSQATDASFTINGISGTVTRSSNTFSDLIPGVTFNLEATGSATVTVSDDIDGSASKIDEWVNAYNELVTFTTENNLIIREENGKDVKNIFGPLANTRVDDGVLQSIRANLVSSAYSSGTEVKIFADLGITTERNGTLKFDKTVFNTAVTKEPNSTKNILKNFGDTVSLTGGTIDQYIRFGGLIPNAIKGNDSQITTLNDRIAFAEASILKQEETMRQRFSRLEGLVGQLQSQQQALTSALAGLSAG